MVEMVLIVCLAAAPDKCEEKKLPVGEPIGARGCLYYGQLQAAEWAAQHPDYIVKKWRCTVPAG